MPDILLARTLYSPQLVCVCTCVADLKLVFIEGELQLSILWTEYNPQVAPLEVI